ncbi:hypothetical protein LXD69_10140 [Flavobacterium sediminilitoris]|uniref:Uncharacterized protein n=1 Tax=Flavobacterium sediminilitoris TaxID=2024526 RepID=A0ABY4HHU9_9FLAO|nr:MULTISPECIES: hypothetical protein [Flavobacterium]UOX32411.1 hypothetical protein LXD69_10140 [Flavobacterium sediminilitoris]
MAVTLEDIGTEVCEPVAGLSQVYYSLHGDYVSIEDPADICGTVTASTFAELVEIPDTPGHVMAVGKQMFELKFVTETGTIKSTMVGEKARRLFENELVVEVSGSEANLLGFLRWIKNQQLVFHVVEFGTGNVRQLGSKRLPAWVEGIEHSIEAVIEGKNSVTITLKDKQKWPSSIYKGALQLTPVP